MSYNIVCQIYLAMWENFSLIKAKSEKLISLARRSLPSFHGGFIALVLGSNKS